MRVTRTATFPRFLTLSSVWLCTLALAAAFAAAQDAADETDTKPEKKEPPAMEYVKMTTSKGDIYLELNRERAPISVENFLTYVEDKHYDDTIVHRVIPTFMIQGGGFTADMQQKPTRAPIRNEWQNGLKNERGTIAMARTTPPDTATAQFFINVVNNASLDQPVSGGAGYAVFGKVIAGMDVVDAIKGVATTTRSGHQNVPVEPVVIEKVRRISKEDAQKAVEHEKKAAEKSEGGE